ncbi:ABC transporter substrate-binding protein [Bordetella genomosp. 1]|uniref:ABC transporter substrate-binding protein n=1 Tax=Bordetella genomosp. 1 TaxID=1395607 RepID=A0A261S786_9BORD|nr:extracellular solute-binding protein [Bordetella genomosp. 1]MDQ8031144.1 extracellular solute-binding protein [Bordetella sp.]OZI33244.1 ABC transporter substrate-binding protein [Bordetella genomosp. 1]OZI57284.1 ABC transporter substrate-binding protein [Bordetella genomosp. 1]
MRILRPTLAAALLATCLPALAGTVTVITSFPKDLTQAYKTAFEKANPGITLEILNKNTVAGIAFVRETPAGQRPEVFWASAPDAFEVLARDKLLVKAPDALNKNVPDKIGSYPINDPSGLYMGQALAGYGIMYNTRYLKAHKLAAPVEWKDLLAPQWFGHVGITAPSRSGTMHLTVETILQGEGWDDGWQTLLRMSGNASAVTERSFGVPDGVNNGQFAAGPVIDFFGLSSKYSKFPVEFVYPSETAIVPANIALIDGAKNSDEGKKFIAFTLSEAGQKLLLEPKISRLPVLPYDQLKGSIPEGYPNPADIAKRSKVHFDADLSQSRYYVVQSLYDQTITFRLKELQAATRAIYEAEAKLGDKARSGKAAELLAQARKLAWAPLVDGKRAADPEFLKIFAGNKKDAAVNQQITKLEGEWNGTARANYEEAVKLARQAAAL